MISKKIIKALQSVSYTSVKIEKDCIHLEFYPAYGCRSFFLNLEKKNDKEFLEDFASQDEEFDKDLYVYENMQIEMEHYGQFHIGVEGNWFMAEKIDEWFYNIRNALADVA